MSQIFRTICQERFSFSKNLTILEFEPYTYPPGSERYEWFNIHIDELGIFTFQDQNTGNIMQSKLDGGLPHRKATVKNVTTWCPVIGGEDRPSMMTQIQLGLLLRSKCDEGKKRKTLALEVLES